MRRPQRYVRVWRSHNATTDKALATAEQARRNRRSPRTRRANGGAR